MGAVAEPTKKPGGLLARARVSAGRPAAPAVMALVSSVVFVVERLVVVAHGQVNRFVMAEHPFVNPAQAPKGLYVMPRNGYDGQFFYRLALNPANLHATAFGITFDSRFRVQRIGYPVLAWLVSFGHHQWVPTALVVVNVAALTAIGYLGGCLARDAGRHRMWGLLAAGYFGFLFSLGRDLAEPVAAACLLAGILAYRRHRPGWAAVALAYGALSRETVMVAVAAIALVRLGEIGRRRALPGADDLAWVVPSAVFAAWQAAIYWVTGAVALSADASSNTGLPGAAVVHAVVHNLSHAGPHALDIDAWVVEFVVLAAFVVMAATALRSTTAPVHERLAFGLFIIELFVLSPLVWNGVADLRSLDEVYLFSVLILLGSRRRLWLSAVVLAPAFVVVAAHRALSL